MRVVNPYTGEPGEEYPEHSATDIASLLAASRDAARSYAASDFVFRRGILARAAAELRADRQKLAELMTHEMGKPVTSGLSEVDKCAWVCEYYAENGEAFLANEVIESDASKSLVCYRPLGVILAVMPWNFPLWQVFRAAAPALMAGNGMVLKHASNVPGCALAMSELWRRAGAPEGLFATVLAGSESVAWMIESDSISAVTLTGSTPAGRAVASVAGAALKKCVLELGGNDPYVVLSDANLELAAEQCVTSRLINSGQSCIAAKRFVVVQEHYDDFVGRVVEKMSRVSVGDPSLADTVVGPMARHDLRDQLHEQVTRSIASGAKCVLGGEVPEHPGAMYPPTVLRDVGPEAAAYREELFGPVAALIRAADDDEAIAIANDTEFGLGAAVFTRDVEAGERIATDQLNAGACFVNAFVRSDPRLPFGGIKASGYGRELSHFGIREFTNPKTVYIA